MQKRKRKRVDRHLCDRFMAVFRSSGMLQRDFVRSIGLTSISIVNEIERYVTEPSKPMIVALCRRHGVSANWMLLGEGRKFRMGAARVRRPGRRKG